jgi:DNA-binding protein YbaB
MPHDPPRKNFDMDQFSTRSQQDLVQIVMNGGGLDMKAGTLSQQDLVQLAQNASARGTTIILRELGTRSSADLVQIAANGKGNVLFVLED